MIIAKNKFATVMVANFCFFILSKALIENQSQNGYYNGCHRNIDGGIRVED